MFYKSDTYMTTLLLNIYEHMKADYDNLLIVVGDTGTGKSRFALHLLDHWYRVILEKPVTKDMSVQVASDYKVFLNNFKVLKAYDMNIYDEGATTLDSKSSMNVISRDIIKLFNVFRAKKFFTVIVLPSFFDLNKYLRERRLRGLVWVDKRGHYKYYTKKAIHFLNGFNERRNVKSMFVVKPSFSGTFPDYNGLLLKNYELEKNKTIKKVLNEVVDRNAGKRLSLVDIHKSKVSSLLKKGKTYADIRRELGIGSSTITRCVAELRR